MFIFRFSSLPTDLIDAGYKTKSFDGIIIDTSSKINQLQNKNMYLHKTKLDKLDLRDESTDSEINLPSASDVLQHIGEKELYKLLKYYGQLGSWSKHIVEKIIEARYMFHQFETIPVNKFYLNIEIKMKTNSNIGRIFWC